MAELSIVKAPVASISSATSGVRNTISSAASSLGNTLSSGASSISNTLASPSISVGVRAPQFLTPNTSPNLSLGAISTPQINITSAITNPSSLNLSGIGSSLGIPTSPSGIASTLGLSTPTLPSTSQAINTLSQGLGINIPTSIDTTSISQAFTGAVSSMLPNSLSLSGLEFPKIPSFPGLDRLTLLLGAGKNMIAKALQYQIIVPPFIPGLKINIGMAMAAVAVVKALATTNPSELIKHLVDGVISDIKSEVADQLQSAIDSTGISDVQGQLNNVMGGAKDSFVNNFNKINPPQTTTNEDGDIIEIPAPKPDLSRFGSVDILPPQGTGILQSTTNNIQSAGSSILSQAKAFTFPPKG